jgi:hypothetical protein
METSTIPTYFVIVLMDPSWRPSAFWFVGEVREDDVY